MSAAVKVSGAQAKHLTQTEIQNREQAEASTLAFRTDALQKRPKGLSAAAKKYWDDLMRRFADIDIVDVLDREMLMLYCQMLARRDALNRVLEKMLKIVDVAEKSCEDAAGLEAVSDLLAKVNAAAKEVASLERNLMVYADKLGCTPQSRVRLAQRKAASANDDPDAAFFGD